MTFFALPDSPTTAKFLTADEKDFVVRRLQADTGSGRGQVTNSDKITVTYVLDGLKEWRIRVAVIIYLACSVGAYGFSYTVLSVIKELGYSAANAQLLTIPIYVCAMIFIIAWSILSDRYQQRSPFIMGGLSAVILGFVALLSVPHPRYPGLTYGFLFPEASGLYSFLVPLVCWIGNNLAPSSKRAVGMALLISGGNLGGIAGSNIYLQHEAPHYWTGYGFSLAVAVFTFVATYTLRTSLKRENARRDASGLSDDELRERYTDPQLLQPGDKSPYFRYTL